MEQGTTTPVTIEAIINAPIEKVWDYWTGPEHIIQWNSPSADWFTPKAENDLKVGGSFSSRMEARDGSFGFDFSGTYDAVDDHKHIAYTIADGRKVKIYFSTEDDKTKLVETFDTENENPVEMQRAGWQAILDNFKKYTEK